jgi:hypothetical protein
MPDQSAVIIAGGVLVINMFINCLGQAPGTLPGRGLFEHGVDDHGLHKDFLIVRGYTYYSMSSPYRNAS